ncbi:unnamed protein product, partial [Owenia fusiformis]
EIQSIQSDVDTDWKICNVEIYATPACRPVSEIEHGSIENSTSWITSYTCNERYENATSAVNCYNHTWSQTPSCTLANCEEPPTTEHGRRNFTSTLVHSIADYTCDEGYQISNITSLQCSSNDSWVPYESYFNDALISSLTLVPECYIVDCGQPQGIKNGSLELPNGTTYNSVANYSCNDGFYLRGSKTVICETSGNWTSQGQVCHPIPTTIETTTTTGDTISTSTDGTINNSTTDGTIPITEDTAATSTETTATTNGTIPRIDYTFPTLTGTIATTEGINQSTIETMPETEETSTPYPNKTIQPGFKSSPKTTVSETMPLIIVFKNIAEEIEKADEYVPHKRIEYEPSEANYAAAIAIPICVPPIIFISLIVILDLPKLIMDITQAYKFVVYGTNKKSRDGQNVPIFKAIESE